MRDNLILGFDVSNNNCSVAISLGERILCYNEILNSSVQAEQILPMIEYSLEEVRLSYRDINYLVVTNGPGNFTGVRIGLSVAKSIVMSTKIIGIGISNFEVSYLRAIEQVGDFDKVIVILKSNIYQSYLQIFSKAGDITEPKLIDNSDIKFLVSKLTENNLNVLCVGNALSIIYQNIKFINNLMILPRFTYVKAVYLCRFINLKIRNNDITPIKPLYVRLPDTK
ncbi:tRNA (adenosine(37)-N6)-threonylcarbamoyltransferase complex dimerization subunit type 1 TsaB [Rickettsia endosymbiont of Cardiosporidium cionae]|uniref:tRNA (adenosine(37)-N6)-threonylcarbamoyltransferase complex dimerization subunit type 1 TsaB n=1 Tax=Rickettsia endosymbiont of Cardiosporidium cionae TaxID=2777155 RepID=UPI001893F27C|nr:tRNA (adenosine(37)-N6)-threonylcarbamoyltransferase complex dimerization subunit type 1 TsaB [Rickettsia endosymbiont of Cardiosporidium cionae]KAF8818346.1 tRNA (adenosine(37)-N6)-threonylcarbamoyltransferase complex dimerization subunit type 1 TsaB [Rickettsia endosymbiont of Cardiosporidium cionae]